MKPSDFEELLALYLLPVFPGSRLGRIVPARRTQALVAYDGPCCLLLKPEAETDFRVELRRSQRFSSEERAFIGRFAESFSMITRDPDFIADLAPSVPRRAIARHLAPGRRTNALAECIQIFESLSGRTYEGRPVVGAVGLSGTYGLGPLKLRDLWQGQDEFSSALGTGFDSLFTCGQDGRVFGIEVLPVSKGRPRAPLRFGAVAAWTRRRAGKKRTAVVLNRNGDVLVFADGELQFAKRRGAWRYYTFDSVSQRMGTIGGDFKRALIESCLDVSFARTGGGIAVFTLPGLAYLSKVVDPADLLIHEAKGRTKLLQRAIRKPFAKLDRRLRQELLAVDGALILNHRGEVQAVGAIVKVPKGSTGGGRKAAAIELSRFGLGIKISSDGPVTGYRKRKEVFVL